MSACHYRKGKIEIGLEKFALLTKTNVDIHGGNARLQAYVYRHSGKMREHIFSKYLELNALLG